MWRCI